MFKEIHDIHHDQQHPSPSLTLNPSPSSESVLPHIVSYHADRLARNTQLDRLDLAQTIQTALRSNNDANLIEVLQVEKTEMKEAIKTLQRALEEPRLTVPGSNPTSPVTSRLLPGTDSVPILAPEISKEKSTRNLASEGEEELCIHREFIEEEIGALRRISGDADCSLPSVSLNQYQFLRLKTLTTDD